MGGDLLSTLVKIKSIVKLANTSLHSLCTSSAFNVPKFILVSIIMYPTMTLIVSLIGNIRRRLQKKRRSSLRWSKTKMNVEEARCGPIKKNSPNNKSYNQQQSNKKANGNGDTKINNWVHLVDSKLMFLCNKVCGLIPHTSLVFVIYGPPVWKIINPSTCLLPMYFKKKIRKWHSSLSWFQYWRRYSSPAPYQLGYLSCSCCRPTPYGGFRTCFLVCSSNKVCPQKAWNLN